MNIFVKNSIEYTISLEANYINKNINRTLMKKIKEEIECKCIKEGYVKKDSVKILYRSPGQISTSHFNGNIMYNLKIQIEVCNPLEGDVIDVTVKNINKMGILGESGDGDVPPISVLMAKQHHIDNDLFDVLKVNSKIKVKIIGKRFEYGDNQINVIGVLQNQDSGLDYISEENDNDSDLEVSNEEPNILKAELKDPLLDSNIDIANEDNVSTPIEAVDLGESESSIQADLGASSNLEAGDEINLEGLELNNSKETTLDVQPLDNANMDLNFDNLNEVDLSPDK